MDINKLTLNKKERVTRGVWSQDHSQSTSYRKSTAIQEVPGVAKFIETEGRTVVTRAGVGDRALFFNGYRVSVWDDGKFLEIDDGDDCATL